MLNPFRQKKIKYTQNTLQTPDHKITKFVTHFVMEINKSKSNDPYCIMFLIIAVKVTPELYLSFSL